MKNAKKGVIIMAEFIGGLLGVVIVVYGFYTIAKWLFGGAKAISNGIKSANDLQSNIGNPEWERTHRAQAMQHYWTHNNSPISLGVRTGHMTTYVYTREMSPLSVPDSAGGWDLQVTIRNKGNQTIKYIKIPFTPFNTVGDQAYSSIAAKSTVISNFTGPIAPGQAGTFIVEKPWYNIDLGWIETGVIEITFMDGSIYRWDSFPSVRSNG